MVFFSQNIAQKKTHQMLLSRNRFSTFFLHIIFGRQLTLTGFHVNKLCESVHHFKLNLAL